MTSSTMINERRLKPILETATEGKPDYWYGAVDGFAGSLWSQLFLTRDEAAKVAEELQGSVVIVAARILEDEDGEQIIPEN